MKIIDEDVCAKCSNCTLLKEPGRKPWEVEAECSKGWPYTLVFHNVISTCSSLVLTHNVQGQRPAPADR